jgi:hypothetical protein
VCRAATPIDLRDEPARSVIAVLPCLTQRVDDLRQPGRVVILEAGGVASSIDRRCNEVERSVLAPGNAAQRINPLNQQTFAVVARTSNSAVRLCDL